MRAAPLHSPLSAYSQPATSPRYSLGIPPRLRQAAARGGFGCGHLPRGGGSVWHVASELALFQLSKYKREYDPHPGREETFAVLVFL